MLSLFRHRVLVAVLSLTAFCAVAVGAQAAKTKATGGTSTLTPSPAAMQALSGAGLTLAPIAPATAGTDGSFVFPIVRGHYNADTLRGRIFHSGGLAISNGKRTVRFHRLIINSTKRGASLYVLVRVPRRVFHHRFHRGHRGHGHHAQAARRVVARIVLVRLGSLVDPQRSSDGSSVTVTVKASKALSRVVNRLAKKHIVSAGNPIGTLKIAPTPAPAAS